MYGASLSSAGIAIVMPMSNLGSKTWEEDAFNESIENCGKRGTWRAGKGKKRHLDEPAVAVPVRALLRALAGRLQRAGALAVEVDVGSERAVSAKNHR